MQSRFGRALASRQERDAGNRCRYLAFQRANGGLCDLLGARLLSALLAGHHHVRLENHALQKHPGGEQVFEPSVEHEVGHLLAAIQRVASVHQDFGLDDGHNPRLLAQGRVARQRFRIGVDGIPGWDSGPDIDHCAPLREFRAQLVVLGEPLAQSIESFGNGLAGKTGQRLRSQIDLDAGKHSMLCEIDRKRYPVLGLLADGLVIHDDAADVFRGTGSGKQHFPVRAPILFGGFELDGVEAPLDGARAFVSSQNSSTFRDQRARGSAELCSIHVWPVSLIDGLGADRWIGKDNKISLNPSRVDLQFK